MFVRLAPVPKTVKIHNARHDFYIDKIGPVSEFHRKLDAKNDTTYLTSLCTVPMNTRDDLDIAMLYINVAGGYANYEMVEPFAIFGTAVISRANANITPPEKKKEILTAFADNVATLINCGSNHRMMHPALDIMLKLNAESALDDHTVTLDTKEFTEAVRLWNNARDENTPRYADAYGPNLLLQ